MILLNQQEYMQSKEINDGLFDKGECNTCLDLLKMQSSEPKPCLQPIRALTGQRQPRQSICAGCDKPLGDCWIQNSLGGDWHPPCFLCTGCQKPITESQFQVQGRDPYHKPCYQKKFDPVCEVCHDYIPIDERSGMIQWRFHPYWGTKYCPAHELDQTARCVSCERMQPRDQRYTELDNMQKLCLQCFDSVVLDVKDSQSVYDSVRDFYSSLGLNIEQEIPLLLVDTKALKAAAEKDGHHRFEPEARGMCLSEEHIIETVSKLNNEASWTSLPATRKGHSSAMRHKFMRQLVRKSVVTSILVLSGFPRLLTGSIIAHEMMHAWLKLKGPFPYLNLTHKSQVEEGICQFMAYLWLQNQIGLLRLNASKKDEFEVRLGECFMQQIERHDSSVYGDGFRAARVAVAKYGLQVTLDHIKTSGHFEKLEEPPVDRVDWCHSSTS